MAQYDLNLRDIQRILRRRWRVILFATLLVLGFSYLFGRSRQPLYSSFSSVKIEETGTMSGLLMQRMTYSRWDNIATAQELIRSFPVMELVAKRLGKIDASLSSDDIRSDTELSDMVNRMISMVETMRNGRTNIIDIQVTTTNPYEARDIAQELAVIFTEEHLKQKSSQDRETREFIETQLRQSKGRLQGAERQLQAFRETSNLPVVDEQISMKLARLTALRDQVREINQKVAELDVQLMQIKKRRELGIEEDSLRSPGKEKGIGESKRIIDWFEIPEQRTGPTSYLNARLIELEEEKRALLSKFRASYPAVQKLEAQIKELLGEIELEGIDKRNEYLDLLGDVKDELAKLESEMVDVPEQQRRYAQLLREVNLSEEQYLALTIKYQEALIREADQADEVSVVRPAMLNQNPINIDMNRMISVGLVIGLTLGLLLAFIFETFDTSIGTIEDVEEYLQVPVLGVIPSIDIDAVVDHILRRNPALEENKNLEASARLVTHFAPKDPVAEGYRALRTAMQFRAISTEFKTLTCTSASLQEGKSTTLVNLALSLAQGGKKVLLVGCNLRRPSIYKVFGIDQAPGVVDIVLGRTDWRSTIKTVTDIIMGDFGMDSALMTPGMENLHIITSGGIPPNPSEMLVSEKMDEFIKEAREEFDLVIFDTPPILPVTDSAILSKRTDATLLVYRSGKVPRAALRRAKIQLESVGANVIGVVLNDLKSEMIGYTSSHYYYGKYYGSSGDLEVIDTSMKKKKSLAKLNEKIRRAGMVFGRKKNKV